MPSQLLANVLQTASLPVAELQASVQIWTNRYQKELQCDALQMLYHTSPIITLGMLLLCPVFHDMEALQNYEWNLVLTRDIAISCAFALGVNISNYLILGKTGPLTYQVLGHLKTILILLLGFLLFGKSTNPQNIIGICIAMVGVISYTEVKRRMALPTLTTPLKASAPSSSSGSSSGGSEGSKLSQEGPKSPSL